MRERTLICGLFSMVIPLCSLAQGADSLLLRLAAIEDFRANARFEVMLPQASDPVAYQIEMQSASPGDSLAPCRYILSYSSEDPMRHDDGFAAYFDGNHYRFRNSRLVEYHADTDPAPFIPVGSVEAGVQQQARFVEYLPQMMAQKIASLLSGPGSDTISTDTRVSGRSATVIKGISGTEDYTAAEYSYAFASDSMLPLRLTLVNNPGGMNEQTVDVIYDYPIESTPPTDYTEAALIERWPDVFDRFRQSTFRVENLPGTPLPTFSESTLSEGVRFTHKNGDGFDATTLIVFIDPSVATAEQTVASIRNAMNQLPMTVNVLWAPDSNNRADISELIGEMLPGETTLISPRSLANSCGISLRPTILLVGADGIVKNFIIGFNNDLESVVIEKTMLIK